MKQVRPTIILMILFFAGLLGLWRLDRSGVPTEAERRARQQRVLPGMVDAADVAIRRIEIERDGKALAFERRGNARWQMVRPLDVAADPAGVETLLRNLRELRRSPDAGAVAGPAESYGLDSPAARIRIFSSSDSEDREIGSLEIGKTIRGVTYVRAGGTGDIDVIDGKLAASLERPVSSWREVNLVPTPSFQATGLSATRGLVKVAAERSAAGRWRLTAPVAAPADGPKVESLLAALSAVRVLGEGGFVADDVKDFAPYGLDHPEATLEVRAPAQAGGAIVLMVGKKVPGHDDRVYVRRGDQDDVVEVSDRFLAEVPRQTTALRSQSVADFNPTAVREIQVETLGTTFRLERQREGWHLLSPRDEKADNFLVQSFLNQLDGLKASEFLPTEKVLEPGLNPPVVSIKLWQAGPADGKAEGRGTPSFSLQIGRHDTLRKTMYGRLEGDDVILALPDAMLDRLPRSRYAFRDRSVLSVNPATVGKLTVSRPGLKVVAEPDRSSSTPNQWKLVSPVKAPADVRAVTQILTLLSDLQVEEFAGDIEAAPSFGLDKPVLSVSWEVDAQAATAAPADAKVPARPREAGPGRLDFGKPAAGKPGASYASLEGKPYVFVLPAAAIESFGAELRDTAIFSTSAADIRRLVFRLPGRTLAFIRRAQPKGDATDWSPDRGTDMTGVDLSRFNDLVAQVSRLRAQRFLQYDGPIPEAAGLARPRLEIELQGDPARPAEVLRLGRGDGTILAAAAGRASSGAVFALPAPAWDALIESLGSRTELPNPPFAP